VKTKRYNHTVESAAPRTVRIGPVSEAVSSISTIIAWTVSVQAVMLVVGNVIIAATFGWSFRVCRWVFVVSFLPWVVSGMFMVLAQWQTLVGVLETASGRDLNRDGEIGDIRLVRYRGPTPLVEGVPEGDLIEFIREAVKRGHQKSVWVGHRFKSGRRCSYAQWKAMTDILARHGWLEGQAEGVSGVLLYQDPEEVLEHLELV
jgi:hypothetical protein